MSFFDEIGAKITQTGQKAKKTANDLVGAAKLSSQVTERMKAIQALYEKLGEQYYQFYGQQPAEELRELCMQIKESQDELSSMQAELQRLKNVKACPQCGYGNTADAKFCAQCSAPLPELPVREPQGQETFCSSCGAKLTPGASFCTKCGTKV